MSAPAQPLAAPRIFEGAEIMYSLSDRVRAKLPYTNKEKTYTITNESNLAITPELATYIRDHDLLRKPVNLHVRGNSLVWIDHDGAAPPEASSYAEIMTEATVPEPVKPVPVEKPAPALTETTIKTHQAASLSIIHPAGVSPAAIQGPLSKDEQIAWMATMKCATQIIVSAPDRSGNAFAEGSKVLLLTEYLHNAMYEKFDTRRSMNDILGVNDA